MRRGLSVWLCISVATLYLLFACANEPPSPAAGTAPALIPTACKKPEYPVDSLNAGEVGTVRVKLLVDAAGGVKSGAVERSSGHERLDTAALAALKTCKFKPAMLDGKPVSAWTSIEYAWALKEPDSKTTPPVLIADSCEKPSFNASAPGIVMLRFLVNADGKVAKSTIERSSGYSYLDDAAQTALERCRFEPAMRDGKPTSAWAAIEYVFTIRGEEVRADRTTSSHLAPSLIVSSCEKPQYPPDAMASGKAGNVRLRFVVNEGGRVTDSKVVTSSGDAQLDAVARSALERCQFEPAIRDGIPKTAPVELEYVWSLRTPSGVRTLAVIQPDSCDKPEYPEMARRLNESGTVAIRFFIDESGMVVHREIERSSGFFRLDNAAAAGLSLCKFTPAMFDGKPIGAWTRLEYVFRFQ